MKNFGFILFLLLISCKLQAQQLTKVDCCVDVGSKATIIINSNNGNSSTTVTSLPAITANNNCNFKLSTSCNTSAGVYDSAGNLIRTLWNGVRYDAGCYNLQWDGNLDNGTIAPFGNYTVKILTNNVQYTWEGVIGNTSTDFTGDYLFKGENLEDVCFVGTKAFFANGYAEHSAGQKMFLTTNVGKLANERYEQTTQSTYKVCTDGIFLYWFGYNQNDGEGATTFIYKAYPADNANPYATMGTFSAGQALTTTNSGVGTVSYASVASLVRNNWNARPTGICVQKTGNLLFAARAGISQLQVLDKNTGALLQTYNYAHVFDVACDDSNHLWATIDHVLHKFNIGSDGTLTDLNISFTGLTTPTCLGISPDYSTISVGDNGTYQVKSYSTSNNVLSWTLGQAGGYGNSPYTANDKFFYIHFVKYAPDGSFWVGDKENFRTVHFNADRTYKDFIGFIPTFRTCMVDQNNPKRVFAGFVEYERDYTKTLDNGANGSWKLKANWQSGIDNLNNTTAFLSESLLDNYSGFYNVVTLNNNRTYGKIFLKNDGVGAEVELTATGLRHTGSDGAKAVGRDGTLFYVENILNDHVKIHKKPLTGFDSNGNPQRPNDVVFVTTPAASANEYSPGWYYEYGVGHTNASDKYVFFQHVSPPDLRNQGINPDAITGYHLGAIKAGDNKYLWKASKSTFTNYYGSYPTNGDYDIGNGWPGQHSDGKQMVYDHDIFFNANGEFWKGGEINIWNHFYDDGLLIGHFGVSGVKNNNGFPGMAGNAINNAMAKVGNNDYYIYHCDESTHAGIHSWHVTGLNTVSEQSMPINVTTAITASPDPTSLMTGIPFRSTFAGGNGWIVDQPTTGLNMVTNAFKYQRDSIDVKIEGYGTQVVKRTLNNNGNLNTWTLSGGMTMQDSEPTIGSNNYNYLDVLDVSGKIIARFQVYANPRDGYHTYFLINSNPSIADGFADFYNYGIRGNFMDFTFNYANNSLTFIIGNYSPVTVTNMFDTGANKSAPAYLRVSQSSPGNQNHAMGLYKLKFTGN